MKKGVASTATTPLIGGPMRMKYTPSIPVCSFRTARTAPEKTLLERQIAATDTQIDRLVYDLYGLTENEIKIVEEEQHQ
jgi:hypothetical protein